MQQELTKPTDTKHKLPLADILKEAWREVKGSKLTFFLALVIFIIIYALTNTLNIISHDAWWSNIILFIVNSLLQGGILYLGLRRAFNMTLSSKMIFKAFTPRLGLKVIGGIILIYLPIIIINAIILLLSFLMTSFFHPESHKFILYTGVTIGILISYYLLVRFSLIGSIIMAQRETNPLKAMKESVRATSGCFWVLTGFTILSFLLAAVGILTIGIGFLWIFPFLLTAWGLIYKHLVGKFTNQ
jgi:hypothetical protein